MDSEAHGAIARLNGLLDELDSMSVGSVGNLENRLSAARAAIEKARQNRGVQSSGMKSIPESVAVAPAPEPDTERTELLERISHYEKQVADLEAVAVSKDARLAQLEGLAETIVARDARIAELEGIAETIVARDARIAELEGIAETIAARDARIAELEGLASEVSNRDEAIAQHQATLEKYKQRESRYAGLDAKLAEYDGKIKALEDVVKAREAQMDELRGSIQERDAQIELLRGQIQDRDQQIKAKDDTIQGLENGIAAGKAQAAELAAQMEQKNEEMHAQQEAAVLLKDEVRQREASIAKLEEKIQRGNADAVALREQMAKMQAENAIDDLQRDLTEKTDKVRSLEGALRTTEEDRAKLELEVKMLLGEIEGMRYQHSELEMLQGKLSKLEADLQEERARVLRLKAQLTAAPAAAAPRENAMPAPPMVQEPEVPATKRVRAAAAGKGRRGARKQMGEILVEAGVLTEEQLQEVIAFQATDPKRKLGTVVVERGYATEEVIAAALAAQMHLRFIESLEHELQPGVIKLVPNHLINNHKCVPLSLDGGQLLVAMFNPLDLIGIENIELATNLRVEAAVATLSEIEQTIAKYFNRMKAYQ
jgi:predicted  nucleic acid-binding Zn-ribbon protein